MAIPFLFADTLTDSTAAAIVVMLIKPLVLIVAFAAIPMSYKAAIGAMGQVGGMINGITQKGHKSILKGDMYKEGKRVRKARQAQHMSKFANTGMMSSLTHSNSRIGRAAGSGFMSAAGIMMLNGPKTRAGINKAISKGYKDQNEALKSFDTEGPDTWKTALLASTGDKKAMAKLQREAPHIVPYTRNGIVSSKSFVKQVGKFMNPELVRAIQNRYGNEAHIALGAAQEKFFSTAPFTFVSEKGWAGFARNATAKSIRDDYSTDYLGEHVGTKGEDGAWRRTTMSKKYATAVRDGWSSDIIRDTLGGPHKASAATRTKLIEIAVMNKDIWSENENGQELLHTVADQIFDADNAQILSHVYKDLFPDKPIPATVEERRAGLLGTLGFTPTKFTPRPHPFMIYSGNAPMTPGQNYKARGKKKK
jgi:hypothetical protein